MGDANELFKKIDVIVFWLFPCHQTESGNGKNILIFFRELQYLLLYFCVIQIEILGRTSWWRVLGWVEFFVH